MSGKPIRRVLREEYECRRDMGGCGAQRGDECVTLNGSGRKTSPHESRWTQHLTRTRSRPRVQFSNPEKLPRTPGLYQVQVDNYNLTTNTLTLTYVEG